MIRKALLFAAACAVPTLAAAAGSNAFNPDLATGAGGLAQGIAASLREAAGGMPGGRAIGLYLEDRGRAQVSTNVHDRRAAPLAELVARVRALGRRYPEEPVICLRVGDITLDLSTHDVHRKTQRIELSPRELMLLKVLMREPGRVFTRTELCERVWEHAHEYDTKLVEVFIGRLRKKLGEPPLIHTIRHVGYTIGRPEGKIPIRRGTNSQRI